MNSFAKCLAATTPLEYGFPDRIKYDHDEYKLSNYFKKSLNSLLDTNFRAVYIRDNVTEDSKVRKGSLDIGCVMMFCVRQDMRVIRFTNSEWGGIDDVTHAKD